MTLCEEPNPGQDGIICDDKPHSYGPHSSAKHRMNWPGNPYPPMKKSRSDEKRELRKRIPIEKRTGAPTGQAGRDKGMALVWENSPEEAKAEARRLLIELAQARETFDSEDIIERMTYEVPNLKVLGPIMGWGKRQGYIEATGRYHASRRPERNLGPVAIWASLVCHQNSLSV